MVDVPWLKLKFIHVLSILFVVFSGSFVSVNWSSLSSELKGAVITLMIIAGWNGVRDYWMGSSSGSDKKTEQMMSK
jgi:predicted Na+-dependent transporter